MSRFKGISRRQFGQAGLLAAASVAWPALGAPTRLEKTKITLAVGGKASFHHLPLMLAEQLGYFRAEGLDLEIIDHTSSARAAQALVSGAADVSASAFEHLIPLQSRTHWVQAFAIQARTPLITFGVSTRSMPGYKSLADLRGKKIGVAAAGSSAYMVAKLVLARAGVNTGDVNFVDAGSVSNALVALRSGQLDAISHTDPAMTMLEQKGDIKIISDTRTLKGTLAVFGGAMPTACLCATGEFIQKNPNTCQALTHALVHALKWLHTAGPGDVIKTVPEAYLLGDRGLYLAAFNNVRESISLDGLMPEDGARTALRAVASVDPSVHAEKIDLLRTYTNEFARRAKDRFKA